MFGPPVMCKRIALFTGEHGCEAVSGNFLVSVRDCLTSAFKYIVMQMIKVNCEKGYLGVTN